MPKSRQEAEQNPYWLIEFLESDKRKYKSSGFHPIGKAVEYGIGKGQTAHCLKTIEVHLPANAQLQKIHHFICNIDGLTEGNPKSIPWGTEPKTDYRCATFHDPQTSELDGQKRISVVYDNWSEIETRAGWLIVEFE